MATESDLKCALLDMFARYPALGFRPANRVVGMIKRRGAVKAVERLLDPKKEPQSGFKDLVKGGKPEMTVEGLILASKGFPTLFQREHLLVAYGRLTKAGYTPRWRP